MTDAELLTLFAENRSPDAFKTLLERHLNLIYAAALRQVHDPGMAEDIVQSVSIILSKKAASLRASGTNLPAWLLTVTRHAVHHARKSRMVRIRYEQKAAAMENVSSSIADFENLSSMIDSALNRISEPDRTAIAMFYLENRSLREVGAALAISEDAAQKRVSRALNHLRRIFEGRGIYSPADALEINLHQCGAVTAPPALLAAAFNSVISHGGASIAGSTIAHRVLRSLLFKKVAIAALSTLAIAAVVVPVAPVIYHAVFRSPSTSVTVADNTTGSSLDQISQANSIPVSIDAQNMPAQKAFQIVLSGAKISYTLATPDLFAVYQVGPVTLNMRNLPLQQVLWELYRQTGVRLDTRDPANLQLRYITTDPQARNDPVYFGNNFAIELQDVAYLQPRQLIRVDMNVYAFPGLSIVQSGYGSFIELQTAVDNLGQSLLTASASQSRLYFQAAGSQMSAFVFLKRIDNIGTTIADLQGSVWIPLGYDRQQLTFHNLGQLDQTLAVPQMSDLKITFNGVTQTSTNTYQVDYSLAAPADIQKQLGDPEAANLQLVVSQLQWGDITLLDSSGRALTRMGGGGNDSWHSNHWSTHYNFTQKDGVGPPAKFVFDFFSRIANVKVPFEFKNVPLPAQ